MFDLKLGPPKSNLSAIQLYVCGTHIYVLHVLCVCVCVCVHVCITQTYMYSWIAHPTDFRCPAQHTCNNVNTVILIL
jgi:hypothetical protein